MSKNAVYHTIADQLKGAYATRQPIEPPRLLVDDLDVAGAYRIQQLQEEAFAAEGHRVIGRKIGLTSVAMQQQLGVDSPDFGFFTENMLYEADSDIPVSRFISPKVEPELGFRLGSDLNPDATMAEVEAAIDSVYLAVEIIDSRVRDWDIRLVDTIADNASCGAIILSTEPVDIPVAELPDVRATMIIDDVVAGEGAGSAVMGHPVTPIVWLAHTLAEQGVQLKKGDIILSGSFCAAAPVVQGQSLSVDYGSFGRLNVRFV